MSKQVLSKIDKVIIRYYNKKSASEIRELIEVDIFKYRGLIAKLSKLGLIVTPNAKKKLAKKPSNSYTNVDGLNKKIARDLVIGNIKKSGIVGKVLGLPFETCQFELELLDKVSKDFTFVGCEHNPKTYFNMLQTVIDNQIKMDCHLNEVIDTIKGSQKNELAHAFLDYCGTFESFANDIETILKKKIVGVGGTVALTLTNRGTSDIIDEMNTLEPIGVREGNRIQSAIKTFITKRAKDNYATVKVFSYKDDEKQAMILFILERVK